MIVGYHIFLLVKEQPKDNLILFIFIVQTCTVDSGFLGHFDVRQTIFNKQVSLARLPALFGVVEPGRLMKRHEVQVIYPSTLKKKENYHYN